jgi:hypothetical protein
MRLNKVLDDFAQNSLAAYAAVGLSSIRCSLSCFCNAFHGIFAALYRCGSIEERGDLGEAVHNVTAPPHLVVDTGF